VRNIKSNAGSFSTAKLQAKMRSILAILALTLVWGITSCASNGAATSGSSPVQETIVCLGDSLTSGYNATTLGKDDKKKAWPAVLQNKVNIPVINAGVGGNNTAQGLARVKRDVLSKNPRIVIIELGGNDWLQTIPMDTIKDNLQKIIDMVNDGNRKIYLVTFTFPKMNEPYNLTAWDGKKRYTATFTPEMYEQYKNMYIALASSNNIEFIEDIGDGVFVAKEYISADNMHPNAKGYEIMADNIFKALKPYLEANNLLKE